MVLVLFKWSEIVVLFELFKVPISFDAGPNLSGPEFLSSSSDLDSRPILDVLESYPYLGCSGSQSCPSYLEF